MPFSSQSWCNNICEDAISPDGSDCPKGYIKRYSLTGTTQAGATQAGTTQQTSICCPCSPGTAGTETDNCTKCEAGTYQDQPGKTSCKQCPAGTYQNEQGKDSCNSCEAGTYQDEQGKASCKSCPAGTSQANTRQSSCIICLAGTYSRAGAKECTKCAAGTYQDESGKSLCKSCPAGTYQDESGKDSCKSCPAGTYSMDGATKCTPCAAGTYQNKSEQSSCTPCAAGTYQNESGKTSCKSCPVGTSSTAGAAECPPCPAGTYQAQQGQPSCTPCAAGKYTKAARSTSEQNCIECDSGYFCTGGVDKQQCPDAPAANTPADVMSTAGNDRHHLTTEDCNIKGGGLKHYIQPEFPDWITGAKKRTDCTVNFRIMGKCGLMYIDGVKYDGDTNTNSGYNNFASVDVFYTRPNAGYYLYTKYSNNYCDNTSHAMLYNNAAPCLAGQFCVGHDTIRSCSHTSGYQDTLGLSGNIASGYFSGGGAKTATPSNGNDCVENNTCGPCPEPKAATFRKTMPQNFHLETGRQPEKTWFPAYLTPAKAITECKLSYTYMNDRGIFSQDAVSYSEETRRYDNGYENNQTGKPVIYYGVIFPGYYGKTRTYNECNTKKDMLYSDAEPCPAGKFCNGRIRTNHSNDDIFSAYTHLPLMPECDDFSKYPEENYIDGNMAPGYFATCGAKTATPADTNPTTGDGCVQPYGNEQDCYCGEVSASYYSTGGGTLFSPSGPGNGCLAGYQCGKCAAGKNCPSGTGVAPEEQSECEAGYYCPNTDDVSKRGQQACPAGTTSIPGASDQEDCYIKAGTNGTNFCIGTNCFNIPNDFKAPGSN